MAKTDANKAASFLIDLANQQGQQITNLKLQKLLYYAQSWHLALYDEPLFDGKFQAWVHGPVLPEIYQQYKQYGYQPITEASDPMLDEETADFLAEIFEKFGQYTAWQLESMTHQELPWQQARKNLAPDAASTDEISEDVMKSFYRGLLAV